LLAMTATLGFSSNAIAAPGRCTAIIGSAQLVAPGMGFLNVSDHLTTGGKGRQLFTVTLVYLPEEEPPVVELTKLEHAACGKTRLESTFSADGKASVSGEPGYGIALTFRKYRGTDYLTVNLAKNGRKVLSLTNLEIVPCPLELIL